MDIKGDFGFTIGFFFLLLMGCNDTKEEHLDKLKFIATDTVEYGITMNASEDEFYFVRSDGKWGQSGTKSTIYQSKRIDGAWSEPKVASFSGKFDDSDPHLADNDRTLYFISNRPFDGKVSSADIWKVNKKDNGEWSIPTRLPEPINSKHTEYSPRTDKVGNLYFASDRPGGYGQGDLYSSAFHEDEFVSPENMGARLNSSTGEWNLEISEDGDLIIFESSQRNENISSYGDLYISFKNQGAWSTPQNIKELNTSGSDLYPFLTKNLEYLYYSSSDSLASVDTNIYKISFAEILSHYKK
ncbi:hypothetical protein GTQ34_04580 [Muricauda sp. JGD-17]|uniref:WD40 repeat protein n=1 Tax=Flagellimonas ochracea TaxID=2696472 RepID=A0A964TAC7_9FLAO|nr:PD40 domain-containing protein [Allomuricauda ochracea]NAY91187.1 hypothetical protein [Allomuricauda ochracea]